MVGALGGFCTAAVGSAVVPARLGAARAVGVGRRGRVCGRVAASRLIERIVRGVLVRCGRRLRGRGRGVRRRRGTGVLGRAGGGFAAETRAGRGTETATGGGGIRVAPLRSSLVRGKLRQVLYSLLLFSCVASRALDAWSAAQMYPAMSGRTGVSKRRSRVTSPRFYAGTLMNAGIRISDDLGNCLNVRHRGRTEVSSYDQGHSVRANFALGASFRIGWFSQSQLWCRGSRNARVLGPKSGVVAERPKASPC